MSTNKIIALSRGDPLKEKSQSDSLIDLSNVVSARSNIIQVSKRLRFLFQRKGQRIKELNSECYSPAGYLKREKQ